MSVLEVENEKLYTLPPIIRNNLHESILPEKIDLDEILQETNEYTKSTRSKHKVPAATTQDVLYKTIRLIAITWSPDKLFFQIDQDVSVKKLWLRNNCDRIIYLHSCGFWNERARLGASWRCYPRTRFKLAPGIAAKLFIQASPRGHSPVSSANASLQIAAAFTHDIVIGHFEIPIEIDFQNFVVQDLNEDGIE